MKPKKFMTSVQWGAGMHYFNGCGSESKTTEIQSAKFLAGCHAAAINSRRRLGNRRGSIPTVYVWQMVKQYPFKEGGLKNETTKSSGND
jgi:hypothetical protein